VTPRPLIFISAVSRELRSARQLVANTLTFLGYQPVWQDIFGTETGDLRSMLREKIDQCKGVVQLVGQSYGAGPPTPDEQFGRVSYTQYEALYGRKRGKKVWYLFIDESFPIDAHEPEPEELRELQAAYRRRLQSDTHVFHPLTSSEALEASILKLRGDLTRLRRGVKQWAVTVVALLLALTAATVWLVQAQRRQTGLIQKQGEQVNAMQKALARLADVEAQSKQPGSKASLEEQRASAYGVLERELGLPAGSLAKELPAFALELYKRSDTTPLMRARAAYALGRFDEAEKLSLEVAAQDRQGYESAQRVGEDRRKHAIESYELAGQSAQKRIQYAEAMEHFREAEKLTDRDRNPEDWGQAQFAIANLLIDQGQYGNAENILRSVVGVRNHVLGPEHLDTLRSRNRLNYALYWQAKYIEAEADFRELIKLEEKVLGPEHSDTLLSRHELANIFFGQGKYAEAEAECRLILKRREKALGPEHPDTLRSRSNLALALDQQDKYAEAEAQDREVIKVEEKVLGPEHPDTLTSRNNLAIALVQQGKYAEAEAQYRELIKLYEKVLGPEHPDALRTRGNLVAGLDEQGKYAEAEAQDREVIKIQEKVLGPEHPDTLWSRATLARALNGQGKYAEAEVQFREVIKIQEKVLRPEYPETLWSRATLARALNGQGKYSEAEAQFREVIKIQEKVEGPESSDTLRVLLLFCLWIKASEQA
jgi:tetratricopeptide (TPR) repeat protein